MDAVAHHRETQPLLTCVPSGSESGVQLILPFLQSSVSTVHWPNPRRNQRARELTDGSRGANERCPSQR